MIINYLPEYRKGKSRANPTSKQFVDRVGPLVYDKLQQMGIYSDRTFDYLMRQLAFESANGTSNVARKYNNYGGVRIPGKTQYQSYKNDQAFVDYWLPMMNRRYAKALRAKNIDEYGMALKNLGYYEAPVLQYVAGLKGSTSVGSAAAAYATSRNKTKQQTKQQSVTPPLLPAQEPILKPVINLMPDYMKNQTSIWQPTSDIQEVPIQEPTPMQQELQFKLPPIEDLYAKLVNDQPWVPTDIPTNGLL